MNPTASSQSASRHPAAKNARSKSASKRTPPRKRSFIVPRTLDVEIGPLDDKPHPEYFPNVNEIEIEDGKPVDNILCEKQMRLLTEPLHNSWEGPGEGVPFVAMANVGVFHTGGEPPIVPDALLATEVEQGPPNQRDNLSYFVWLRGKSPDVVAEIVSNREGGEDTEKLFIYARLRVPYYIIFDPENHLKRGPLRVYELNKRAYQLMKPPYFFEGVGLGVQLWVGRYEDMDGTWIRWCYRDGTFVLTGAEQARKAQEQARRDRKKAVQARQRAEDQRQQVVRAERKAKDAERELEQTRQELERLQAHLRAKGIDLPKS